MPTLQKKYTPKQLNRSSIVLAQEVGKFCLSAMCLLTCLTPQQRHDILLGWNVNDWWKVAGVPAALYAIQNHAKLTAYQHLPSVTYSVVNQLKTLMAAIFCYTILGIRQSTMQILALVLLILSAKIIEDVLSLKDIEKRSASPRVDISGSTTKMATTTSRFLPKRGGNSDHIRKGILPLLLANMTSGIAAALGQGVLQRNHRNLYLHSMEMSQGVLQRNHRNLYLHSMEMSAASAIMVLASLLVSSNGQQLRKEGIQKNWKIEAWIPIALHSVGGVLVATVTKHAGAVRKGFALIFGVLLSGIFQKYITHEPISKNQILGAFLACLSLWMHSSFPPLEP